MNIAAEAFAETRNAPKPAAPSLSLVVTSLSGASHFRRALDLIAASAQHGDEIVVLTGHGGAEEEALCRRFGARLVTVPDTSVFGLRAHLPEIARRDWLVLVEDHALPEPRAIAALRDLVAQDPGIELVPFLAVNRGSTDAWGWANFLQALALFWVPIPEPPPFCLPTNLAIRRDVIGTDRALFLGQWEFEVVPRVFARGKVGWSNDVAIDHEKRVGALAACVLHYRNGRASAGINRKHLGISRRVLLREVRKVMTERLAANRARVEPRLLEVPVGTMRRMKVLAAAHAFGCAVGTWFGSGRGLAKLD